MLRIGEIMSYESLRSSFLEARCRWDEHAWLYSVQLFCNVSPVNIYVAVDETNMPDCIQFSSVVMLVQLTSVSL